MTAREGAGSHVRLHSAAIAQSIHAADVRREGVACMWTYQHTETTSASREDVWAIWSDVPRWPDWDPATRKVSIDGPFAAGTHGKVTPNLGPTLKFTINDFRPLENFNFDVTMPGGVIHFGHSLSDAPGGRVAATH